MSQTQPALNTLYLLLSTVSGTHSETARTSVESMAALKLWEVG